MNKRTYKREDMIDLNEANVAKIFTECLAENNPSEQAIKQVSFSMNPNVPKVTFSNKMAAANMEKINYMYGQLLHRAEYGPPNYGMLSFSEGCIKYDQTIWAKNKNVLFAFYYLGSATVVLEPFLNNGKATLYDYDYTIPTLSPNDPNFEEWSKTVIRD